MEDIDQQRKSPWRSMILLLVLTLVCGFGVQLLVMLGFTVISGTFPFLLDSSLAIDFKMNPVFSYSMIIAGSFSTFLFPAWLLQKKEPYHTYFPKNFQNSLLLGFLTLAFMISFVPLMQLLAEWNEQMVLPYAFKGLEVWMREKELEMANLTSQMVMVDRWGMLAVNLFALAVMPAIAEEYYFRGSLMTIIQRIVKNYHLSIWLTAIIFSAIHVQFFGFLPRMLLGAFFGYMLVWTKNIWIPILAHFINNASATILAFYYTRQGKTYEDLQSFDGFSIVVYVSSFVLSTVIGWFFYQKTRRIDL